MYRIVCMNLNQLSFGDCSGHDIFSNVSKLSVRYFHLKDRNYSKWTAWQPTESNSLTTRGLPYTNEFSWVYRSYYAVVRTIWNSWKHIFFQYNTTHSTFDSSLSFLEDVLSSFACCIGISIMFDSMIMLRAQSTIRCPRTALEPAFPVIMCCIVLPDIRQCALYQVYISGNTRDYSFLVHFCKLYMNQSFVSP
jgi:hypothetical protein